jgi:hypothetical protein
LLTMEKVTEQRKQDHVGSHDVKDQSWKLLNQFDL